MRWKSPRDIVTGTDVAAQAAIQRVLASSFPELGFVGEEGDSSTTSNTDSLWLVDPLCGTSNFAFGLPLLAINIALVEQGAVTVGVVCDGASGEIYVAERAHGAWRDGGARLQCSDASGLVSVDPTLAPSGEGGGWAIEMALRIIASQRWTVRVLGTTLALAYLAAGRLAAAVYVSGASPVHLAAGLLLAEEAGAIVTDTLGRPWHPDGPAFVVAASGEIHQALLELVSASG